MFAAQQPLSSSRRVDSMTTIVYYPVASDEGGAMQGQHELTVRVRERRQAAGLTQQQLAERAGLSRQALVAIEAGRMVPSVAVALRLARALGCRVEELFALPDTGTVEARLAATGLPVPPVPFQVRVTRVGAELVAWPATSEAGEVEGVVQQRHGERVLVEPLVDPASFGRGLVIAGCDPALALLAAQLQRWHPDLRVIWIPLGSRAALRALARGEVHIAGTHLWDPATGEFNLPAVQQEVGQRPVALVTLARWVEGLGLQPGNPKGIQQLADLARRTVTLVNREVGSGSRTVLDLFLSREGIDPGALAGYEREVAGHRAVAEAIAGGLADAGPLVLPVARRFGLDFLPLLEERYDLVVPAELLDWRPVQDLLELLTTVPIRRALEASGYDVRPSGTLVARLT
jgi:molybdate-binding protein/DNA-binding XRE family transcriptional regulator